MYAFINLSFNKIINLALSKRNENVNKFCILYNNVYIKTNSKLIELLFNLISKLWFVGAGNLLIFFRKRFYLTLRGIYTTCYIFKSISICLCVLWSFIYDGVHIYLGHEYRYTNIWGSTTFIYTLQCACLYMRQRSKEQSSIFALSLYHVLIILAVI